MRSQLTPNPPPTPLSFQTLVFHLPRLVQKHRCVRSYLDLYKFVNEPLKEGMPKSHSRLQRIMGSTAAPATCAFSFAARSHTRHRWLRACTVEIIKLERPSLVPPSVPSIAASTLGCTLLLDEGLAEGSSDLKA